MSSFSMQNDIAATIMALGSTLQLVKNAAGSYTPSGGVTGQTAKSYTVTGKIVKSVDSFQGSGDLLVDNKRVAILVNLPLSLYPTLQDQIVDGGISYNILDVNPVREGSNVAAWMLTVEA
jgi:hypothetical protein